MVSGKYLSRAAVCSALVLGGVAFVGSPAGAQEAEPLPVQQQAVCVGASAIDSVVYKVNDVVVPQLSGATAQNDVISVEFTVKPECGAVLFGLAAYEAVGPDFDPSQAHLQKLVASNVGVFSAGTLNTLSVTTPDCYYQVDFFSGPVLPQLNDPEAPEQFYSDNGRLIAWDTSGVEVCVDGNETTTTVPETTTTTALTTTTTAPTEVLGEVIERPEVLGQVDQVSGQLAETGVTTGGLVGLGSALVMAGSALSGLAMRVRPPRGKRFR